jgi:hypothetical protein
VLVLEADDEKMAAEWMRAFQRTVAHYQQILETHQDVEQHKKDADDVHGKTVLHYCASKGLMYAISQWLPLDHVSYTPVSGGAKHVDGRWYEHWTAIHEAIFRRNKPILLHLMSALSSELNRVSAELIPDMLSLLSRTMPDVVAAALVILEERLLRTENTIWTRIDHRNSDEGRNWYVSGRERLYVNQGATATAQQHAARDFTQQRAEKDENQATQQGPTAVEDGAFEETIEAWPTTESSTGAILPARRKSGNVVTQVDSKVLKMAGFIGPRAVTPTGVQTDGISPFADIAANCDASVFESLVMKAAVHYKWEQVKFAAYIDLVFYACSLFWASIALMLRSWEMGHPWLGRRPTTHVLFGVVVCMETALLCWEIAQMIVQRRGYVNLWNALDLCGANNSLSVHDCILHVCI